MTLKLLIVALIASLSLFAGTKIASIQKPHIVSAVLVFGCEDTYAGVITGWSNGTMTGMDATQYPMTPDHLKQIEALKNVATVNVCTKSEDDDTIGHLPGTDDTYAVI